MSSKILSFPQGFESSKPLPIPIQLLFGSTSRTLKQILKQRVSLTDSSMLVTLLLLFMVLESAWAFLSVRIVGSGAIQPLGVNCIQPGVFYAMVCTNLSIIEKNHGVVKQMTSYLHQGLLQKMVSLALIHSNASTVKATIKQTATNVLIGKTVSTKSSMVENNRNSPTVEYSNVAILFSLEYLFLSFSFLSFLFFFNLHVVCPSIYCSY